MTIRQTRRVEIISGSIFTVADVVTDIIAVITSLLAFKDETSEQKNWNYLAVGVLLSLILIYSCIVQAIYTYKKYQKCQYILPSLFGCGVPLFGYKYWDTIDDDEVYKEYYSARFVEAISESLPMATIQLALTLLFYQDLKRSICDNTSDGCKISSSINGYIRYMFTFVSMFTSLLHLTIVIDSFWMLDNPNRGGAWIPWIFGYISRIYMILDIMIRSFWHIAFLYGLLRFILPLNIYNDTFDFEIFDQYSIIITCLFIGTIIHSIVFASRYGYAWNPTSQFKKRNKVITHQKQQHSRQEIITKEASNIYLPSPAPNETPTDNSSNNDRFNFKPQASRDIATFKALPSNESVTNGHNNIPLKIQKSGHTGNISVSYDITPTMYSMHKNGISVDISTEQPTRTNTYSNTDTVTSTPEVITLKTSPGIHTQAPSASVDSIKLTAIDNSVEVKRIHRDWCDKFCWIFFFATVMPSIVSYIDSIGTTKFGRKLVIFNFIFTIIMGIISLHLIFDQYLLQNIIPNSFKNISNRLIDRNQWILYNFIVVIYFISFGPMLFCYINCNRCYCITKCCCNNNSINDDIPNGNQTIQLESIPE